MLGGVAMVIGYLNGPGQRMQRESILRVRDVARCIVTTLSVSHTVKMLDSCARSVDMRW